MLIEISRELLLDESSDSDLVALLVRSNRRIISQDDEAWTQFLKRNQQYQPLLSLRKSASLSGSNFLPKPRKLRIVKNPSVTNKQEISIEDADAAATLPYRLLVENHISDGAFLKWIYPKNRISELNRLLDKNLLEIQQQGGCTEIIKSLEEGAYSKQEKFGLLGVLVDSDGLHRGSVSRPIKRIENLCKDKSIDLKILPRRNIENYVEVDDLNHWQKSLTQEMGELKEVLQRGASEIAGITQRSVDLKNYIHFKDGIKKDQKNIPEPKANKAEINDIGLEDFNKTCFVDTWNIAKSTLQKDYRTLWDGFGSKITNIFKSDRRNLTSRSQDETEIICFLQAIISEAA